MRQKVTRDIYGGVKRKKYEKITNCLPLPLQISLCLPPLLLHLLPLPPQVILRHTTRPNNTYVFVNGILAVFVIGVCVFFAYNASQAKNKKTRQ